MDTVSRSLLRSCSMPAVGVAAVQQWWLVDGSDLPPCLSRSPTYPALALICRAQACNNRVVHRSNYLLGWAGNDFRYQVSACRPAQLACLPVDGLRKRY